MRIHALFLLDQSLRQSILMLLCLETDEASETHFCIRCFERVYAHCVRVSNRTNWPKIVTFTVLLQCRFPRNLVHPQAFSASIQKLSKIWNVRSYCDKNDVKTETINGLKINWLHNRDLPGKYYSKRQRLGDFMSFPGFIKKHAGLRREKFRNFLRDFRTLSVFPDGP